MYDGANYFSKLVVSAVSTQKRGFLGGCDLLEFWNVKAQKTQNLLLQISPHEKDSVAVFREACRGTRGYDHYKSSSKGVQLTLHEGWCERGACLTV